GGVERVELHRTDKLAARHCSSHGRPTRPTAQSDAYGRTGDSRATSGLLLRCPPTAMRAHRASQTALKISRLVLYVANDPRRAGLLPSGAAEATEALLRAAGVLQDWQVRAYRSDGFRSMLDWAERRLLPGQTTHVALRKRVLEDETRAAIEAGASRVLVVGAGFDTLALRLARARPHVRFVEIDHPATQSLKRHALDQLDPPPNLCLHPAD